MPKAYVVFTESINDPSGMEEYNRAATPSILESGAKVLFVDDAPQVLEGKWHGERTVVLEFESAVAARAWYESDAYATAKPIRQSAARCNGVILTGFDSSTQS